MSLQRNTPLKAKSELKRKTPMQRTAKKPAKKKRPKTGDWKRWNDELFSLIVRAPGKCLVNGYRPPLDIDWFETLTVEEQQLELDMRRSKCNGNLQCAHIHSRSYLAIRWDEDNAVPACAADHTYFTHHPLEWQEWVRHQFGSERWMRLYKLALTHQRPDYVETLQRLVERAEQLNIDTAKFGKHLPSE